MPRIESLAVTLFPAPAAPAAVREAEPSFDSLLSRDDTVRRPTSPAATPTDTAPRPDAPLLEQDQAEQDQAAPHATEQHAAGQGPTEQNQPVPLPVAEAFTRPPVTPPPATTATASGDALTLLADGATAGGVEPGLAEADRDTRVPDGIVPVLPPLLPPRPVAVPVARDALAAGDSRGGDASALLPSLLSTEGEGESTALRPLSPVVPDTRGLAPVPSSVPAAPHPAVVDGNTAGSQKTVAGTVDPTSAVPLGARVEPASLTDTPLAVMPEIAPEIADADRDIASTTVTEGADQDAADAPSPSAVAQTVPPVVPQLTSPETPAQTPAQTSALPHIVTDTPAEDVPEDTTDTAPVAAAAAARARSSAADRGGEVPASGGEASSQPAKSAALAATTPSPQAATAPQAPAPTVPNGTGPSFEQVLQQTQPPQPPAPLTAPQGRADGAGGAHPAFSGMQAPVTEQISLNIRKALDDGNNRIRIKMQPASLGQVEVRLEVGHDGSLKAVLAADKHETFEWLQRDARSLERALQDSGFKTDSNSLSFQYRGGDGQQGAFRDAQQQRQWATRDQDVLDATVSITTDAPVRQTVPTGRLDINV